MLDNDFWRHVGRFAQGVGFADEDLALDAIHKVGLGIGLSHMTTDHTLTALEGIAARAWRDLCETDRETA